MDKRFEKVRKERPRSLGVAFRLYGPGEFSDPDDAAIISASGEAIMSVGLSAAEARALADALVALADAADAKWDGKGINPAMVRAMSGGPK